MESERRQRLYRAEAVIIKRRDFGEADRLVTCFTREHGKLTLLAKGVRKITSRKAGHVELFTHARLLVAKGRTWDIITQAECIQPFLPLREDLGRTGYAYYAAELLDLLTQEQDPNPELFDLFLETLDRLGRAEEPRLPMRYFELHAMGLAGFQPELFVCLGCQQPIRPTQNYFHVGRGGVLCDACGPAANGARLISLPALKVLRYMQTRPYAELEFLRLRPAVHAELEEVLFQYLTYMLERAPKSVQFLRLVRERVNHGAAPAGTAGETRGETTPKE